MIELTEQQAEALERPDALPLRVINPKTQQTFVLLSALEYQRLTSDYDDGPWTDEETAILAAEAGELLDSFGKDP